MALNLKRMVNAIFRYLQIYCSAGTTVGFSSFFAFVNRSLIVPYLVQSGELPAFRVGKQWRVRKDSIDKL